MIYSAKDDLTAISCTFADAVNHYSMEKSMTAEKLRAADRFLHQTSLGLDCFCSATFDPLSRHLQAIRVPSSCAISFDGFETEGKEKIGIKLK